MRRASAYESTAKKSNSSQDGSRAAGITYSFAEQFQSVGSSERPDSAAGVYTA